MWESVQPVNINTVKVAWGALRCAVSAPLIGSVHRGAPLVTLMLGPLRPPSLDFSHKGGHLHPDERKKGGGVYIF